MALRFDTTLAIENATNRRVEVSATLVLTLGTPRTVKGGDCVRVTGTCQKSNNPSSEL